MGRFHNRAVVAQGMLAPSGYFSHQPDPFVQATTRPAGSLLAPSPGYDSVRVGKNRFQGKGPTGGFRPQEFAEDVGGTGAALAVVPGETTQIEASEWLPEPADGAPGGVPEGSMIISDRGGPLAGFATELHEAYGTLPDMGDRDPSRPLTRSRWLYNPVGMLRADFRESPAMTVTAAVAFLLVVHYVANDLEGRYNATRRTQSVPASGATSVVGTAGDATKDAVGTVESAADRAVKAIDNAASSAVTAIEDAGKAAADTVKSAA